MTFSIASSGADAAETRDTARAPAPAKAVPDRRVAALFAGATAALLALAAFSFPYAPLQDFPEWIYQGYVFDRLAAGHASPLFELKHYPVPYSLVQFIVSAALLVFPPMLTSRLILGLYGVVSLFAVHRFLERNRISPAIGWPILLSFAVLNAPFWDGYMSYQSGVIALLFYLGLPRGKRSDWRWLLPLSLLAFFAHGWGYVALLAFAGAYALHDRRLFSCGAAIVPSLALLALYEKYNAPSKMWVMFDFTRVNPVLYKIYTLLKAAPYHNPIVFDFNAAAHFGNFYVFSGLALDAIFLLAILALAIPAARRLGLRAIFRRPETLAGGALLAVALILPPTLLDWGNPGERLMIPGLIALTMVLFDGFRASARAPQFMLATALLGGMTLMAAGLVAGAEAYANGPFAGAPAPERAADASARILWFGHRLAQFDERMKAAEAAWRAGAMPTLPLSFQTGLLQSKKP